MTVSGEQGPAAVSQQAAAGADTGGGEGKGQRGSENNRWTVILRAMEDWPAAFRLCLVMVVLGVLFYFIGVLVL